MFTLNIESNDLAFIAQVLKETATILLKKLLWIYWRMFKNKFRLQRI